MATNTYVALKTTTVATATPTVTLDNIPQGYTDLVIVCNYASTNSISFLYGYFNSDTGTNYSLTELYGNGTSALSTRASNLSVPWLAYDIACSSTVGDTITTINIMNYSNTTTFKTYIARTNRANTTGGAGYVGTDVQVGLWRSTSAITSVTLKNNTSSVDYNFAVGSTFTVYGIAAEGALAKATGGAIYSDSQYWYHAFASSGTFTPTQSLTADILVVAGGGSGGNFNAGGGGAGGLLTHTSQSLTATGYTVTVGAGGAGTTSSGATSNGTNSQFASLTASVGGGGGGWFTGGSSLAGQNGGCGGGGMGGAGSSSLLVGTGSQGYNGGTGSSSGSGNGGGGGGGMGAIGGNATNGADTGGNGGAGITSTLIQTIGVATGVGQSVSGTYYLAGGGGGGGYNAAGTGGIGGGGIGGYQSVAGGNGQIATGSGGGGARNSGALSGSGGSGIVIVRYAK